MANTEYLGKNGEMVRLHVKMRFCTRENQDSSLAKIMILGQPEAMLDADPNSAMSPRGHASTSPRARVDPKSPTLEVGMTNFALKMMNFVLK